MSEWNPCVCQIEKIEKHPNADTLSIYTVLGDYPVIDKTDKYQVGDLAGYIAVDSLVPDIEAFYFLCPQASEQYEENGEIKRRSIGPKYLLGGVPEKYRIIKAKKLRGTYSQGMLVSAPEGLSVGDSIVEAYGLKKWEEEEEENIVIPGTKNSRGANQVSPPKGWAIPYYDVEGLRKYLGCLGEDEEVVLTEKLHGSNFSASFDGEQLWIKSRNYYKKFDEDDMWWDCAIKYDLTNKFSKYPHLVFFGEIHGQVKNFRYDAVIENGKLQTKLRFFDIWDVKNMRFLDYDDFAHIIKTLELETSPLLYRGKWLGKEKMYLYAEGLSTIGKHVREGFVVRTAKERYEPKLDSRMCLKLVGSTYLLQK